MTYKSTKNSNEPRVGQGFDLVLRTASFSFPVCPSILPLDSQVAHADTNKRVIANAMTSVVVVSELLASCYRICRRQAESILPTRTHRPGGPNDAR